MPTQAYFDRFPPFPDDVPIVKLPKLNYHKLLHKDNRECEALYDAAVDHGFFMLDFTDTSGGPQLLQDAVKAFDVGQSYLFRLTPATIGYVWLSLRPGVRAAKIPDATCSLRGRR